MEITFDEAKQFLDQWQREATVLNAMFLTANPLTVVESQCRVTGCAERLTLVSATDPASRLDFDPSGPWQSLKPYELTDEPDTYPPPLRDLTLLVMRCGEHAGLSLTPAASFADWKF